LQYFDYGPLAGNISDAEETRSILMASYVSSIADFTSEMGVIFQVMTDPRNLPVVFHCRAGKDRTGRIAATLLMLLGVPYRTVVKDYLLTNRHRAAVIEQQTADHPYPGAVREMVVAREEYLLAFLDSIHNLYGSVERYAVDGMGMTSSMLDQLRSLLLRP